MVQPPKQRHYGQRLMLRCWCLQLPPPSTRKTCEGRPCGSAAWKQGSSPLRLLWVATSGVGELTRHGGNWWASVLLIGSREYQRPHASTAAWWSRATSGHSGSIRRASGARSRREAGSKNQDKLSKTTDSKELGHVKTEIHRKVDDPNP